MYKRQGYDGTPDHTLASLTQGRLFGLVVACVGDLNGDGFEEHIITEPLNGTGGFGTGTLWLFEGTNESLPGEPDWQYAPSTPNTRIGESVIGAGDINEDGYGDVYVSSRMGSSAGRIEIFLGSATGITSDSQLLAEGNSSERLGYRMAGQGDINGDGLSELIYSIRHLDEGEGYSLFYPVLSERDWESISFTYQGELHDVQLGTAGRGETSIAFTHADGLRLHALSLIHI